MKCKCGADIVRAEVRLVSRCAHGHVASNKVQPQEVGLGVLADPITPGQIRAINGKAQMLDKLVKREPGATKRGALARAGVESTKQLTSAQASDVLDGLEEALTIADPDGSRRRT